MYVYVTMYWSFEKEKTIHISWQALGVFSSHGQRQRWRLAIMDSTHPSRCGCNSFQSLWLAMTKKLLNCQFSCLKKKEKWYTMVNKCLIIFLTTAETMTKTCKIKLNTCIESFSLYATLLSLTRQLLKLPFFCFLHNVLFLSKGNFFWLQ